MSECEPDVLYDVRNGVAHIRLNRPEALNAWTPQTGKEILGAVRAAKADPDVRCGLISGAGPAFCAGADVKNPRELLPDGTPDVAIRLRTIYNPITHEMRSAEIPFIAAVHGACAGLGVSLAMACDITIAAGNAFFLLAFVRLGLSADGGVTYSLYERIGSGRAAELCLLGQRLSADRALSWGMVRSVHAPAELSAVAEDLAARLTSADPAVIGRAKAALGHHRLHTLRRQLALEADMQERHGPSLDYAEGVLAFKEKRQPVFTGR